MGQWYCWDLPFYSGMKTLRTGCSLEVHQVHTSNCQSDQDKGSLVSIKQIFPEAGLFHCAFHRRQNIKKKFGGGEGNTPVTCLWMYNILVKCNSVGAIQFLQSKYLEKMKPAHVAYLETIPANQQFPAA